MVLGREVPAAAAVSRLIGLAFLDRAEAGAGLLIPGCRSVHTFGMRFALDVFFLDAGGAVLRAQHGVPPGRVLSCRDAAAVLELPSRRPCRA